ncbi:tetratricopeptide repeat-containing sensor histidine kinase [Flavipsychrobacter stenotrophus]|nr:tetratricopeptide repeat protein [Flavipsychrobacter stenotrophus]
MPEKLWATKVEDSLLNQLKWEKGDTARIKILIELGDACDVDNILTYAQQVMKLCDKAIAEKHQPESFYLSGRGSALNGIGYYYSHKGETETAFQNYNAALKIFERLGDRKAAAYQLNNIAFIYINRGDVATGLEYQYRNLKVQEEIRDTLGIAYSLNNIGHLFADQHDFGNAMEHFRRSLGMFVAIHNKKGIAMAYENIGAAYSGQANRQQALAYYRKCLEIYEELGDDFYIATALGSCGYEYAKIDSQDRALSYFYRAIAIADKKHIKTIKSYISTSIARILLKRGNIDSATYYATMALTLGKEIGNLYELQKSSGVLKDIYFATGNYKGAYEMQDLELKVRDSLRNETNRKAVIAKKLQYEYDKKELQLKLDNKKKIWEKNILIYSSLCLAMVICIASLLYTRQNKLKTTVARIELEQQQYRAQMNPHFIFNCLNSIQHYIVHNDVMSANKYLSEFASLMRTTMEYNQLQAIVLQQEIAYLNSYLTLEQMRFENKFTYEISCSADVATFDVQVLPTIIQPFAENAIVHGLCYLENQGRLSVYFEKEGNYIVCKIEDNGIGRKASQEIKSRSGKTHVSQGMELVKKRLALASKLHKKSFSAEIIDKTDADGRASGTLVVLKFPLEV